MAGAIFIPRAVRNVKASKPHVLVYSCLVFITVVQVVHDVSAEKLFLRDLVAAGAITDLTGAM